MVLIGLVKQFCNILFWMHLRPVTTFYTYPEHTPSHAAPEAFPIMSVYRKLRNPRRVLRSHAPVPVWEANGRAISVYEHGHDRLGEMVNTG
jgi:hypothetical protein